MSTTATRKVPTLVQIDRTLVREMEERGTPLSPEVAALMAPEHPDFACALCQHQFKADVPEPPVLQLCPECGEFTLYRWSTDPAENAARVDKIIQSRRRVDTDSPRRDRDCDAPVVSSVKYYENRPVS